MNGLFCFVSQNLFLIIFFLCEYPSPFTFKTRIPFGKLDAGITTLLNPFTSDSNNFCPVMENISICFMG